MSTPLRKITGPVMLSRFGQVGAFDNDEQVAELQCLSWPVMWAVRATEMGFDVDGQIVDAGERRIRLIWFPDHKRWGWEFLS